MKLVNRVALITGAVSTTGYEYAKCLLQNGVKVALCDKNFENCRLVSEMFANMFGIDSTLALHCDVTDKEQFDNAFRSCINHFKRLDIVVNNEGVYEESIDNWDIILNTNFGGVVRGTILAIEHMGVQYGGKGGTVIHTSSLVVPKPNGPPVPSYRSLKRAVCEYTRAIGADETFSKDLKIRIMTLCPSLGYDPDNVGRALIHILKRGKTGECWIVKNRLIPRLAVVSSNSYY